MHFVLSVLLDDRQLHKTTFLSSSCFFSLLLLALSHSFCIQKAKNEMMRRKNPKRKKNTVQQQRLDTFFSSLSFSFFDFYFIFSGFLLFSSSFFYFVSLLLFLLPISLPSSSFPQNPCSTALVKRPVHKCLMVNSLSTIFLSLTCFYPVPVFAHHSVCVFFFYFNFFWCV